MNESGDQRADDPGPDAPRSTTGPGGGASGTGYRPGSLIRAAPGLARIAAAAWWNTAEWAATGAAKAGSRAMRAAVSGESAAELFRQAGNDARASMRSLLGIAEIEDRIQSMPGGGVRIRPAGEERTPEEGRVHPDGAKRAEMSLKERGEELMRRSADVRFKEEAHPAFARILDVLAPDEARILRLLAREGAQPSVDVRAGLIPLESTSELIAAGLNMIGAEAGCRALDDVPAYLNNLFRLGLVWFSREPVSDPLRYQVVEAQPEVADALRRGGRGARTVRRSVHLTPFGEDFCRRCLPVEGGEGERRPAPGGGSPEASAADGADEPAEPPQDPGPRRSVPEGGQPDS